MIEWKINPKDARVAIAVVKYPMGVSTSLWQYRNLRRFFVEDGHLFVQNHPPSGETVMVFAPGQWLSIEVEYEPAATE